jgi:hypothetical protein
MSQGLKPAKGAGSDVEAEASTYLSSNPKASRIHSMAVMRPFGSAQGRLRSRALFRVDQKRIFE